MPCAHTFCSKYEASQNINIEIFLVLQTRYVFIRVIVALTNTRYYIIVESEYLA